MLTVNYRGHSLIGVPAIHYSAVFAEQVNRICADESLRPEAIAVELDPAAVNAVVDWLTELNSGPLPCMLGLVRQNNCIHPRHKLAALHLQEATGQSFNEFSPQLLFRQFGYAESLLLCLSPTDSIIEAIRCALELKIPLYGIDRDDSASMAESKIPVLRDPVTARSDFAAYVKRHEREAAKVRDEYGDGRREIVMAARLKTLLARHRRVLFTGGLAHWSNICSLLADDCLRPAIDVPLQGSVDYRRVLVHPFQALKQMDLFPAITAAYQALRQPVNQFVSIRERVNYQQAFQKGLQKAYELFEQSGHVSQNHPNSQCFSDYLLKLGLLSQHQTPDLGTLIRATRAMMPAEFVQAITDAFMEFNWASSSTQPQLPILYQESENPMSSEATNRCVLPSGSAPFYVIPLHSDQGTTVENLQWTWQDTPKPLKNEDNEQYNYTFIWPPCENLFYASIYEAINATDALRSEKSTHALTDSLHQGIDLKATLRATLKGDNRLYVKQTSYCRARPLIGEPTSPTYRKNLELQPTVFIFPDDVQNDDLEWEIMIPGNLSLFDDLSPRGKRLFKQAIVPDRSKLIESIHWGKRGTVPNHMSPWVNNIKRLKGSVRFGNPCINFYQAAAWLEKGLFKAAPIVEGSLDIETITEFYKESHKIDVDLDDWQNALILFALPYARVTRRIAVVCHSGFRISEAVRREARQRRIELALLPITYFPSDRMERIRVQYGVQASQGGKSFPPQLEQILGQPSTKYQELLPRQIVAQAHPKTMRNHHA